MRNELEQVQLSAQSTAILITVVTTHGQRHLRLWPGYILMGRCRSLVDGAIDLLCQSLQEPSPSSPALETSRSIQPTKTEPGRNGKPKQPDY